MMWILVYVGLVVFFYPSLATYFVQDDYWLLAISRVSSLSDFLNFFKPLPDTVWYRPLSSQVFFFTGQALFGLRPIFFHLLVLLTHLLTVYYLYRYLIRSTSNSFLAVLTAFIYGVNQIHTVSLSWLAAYSFVLGPLCLVRFIDLFEQKKYFQAWLWFTAGSFTTEVFWIFILYILFVLHKSASRINIKYLLGFFSVIGVLGILRFFVFPTQVVNNIYSFGFSVQIISTLKFYIYRFLGIPLFISSLTVVERSLIITTVLVIMLTIINGAKSLIYKPHRNIANWLFICIVGIFPFLLLSNHLASYYLSFSFIGFAPLFGLSLSKILKLYNGKPGQLLFISISMLYIYLQVVGVNSTFRTHWIFSRAKLAEELINEKSLIHPVGSEAYYSLGAEAAEKYFR